MAKHLVEQALIHQMQLLEELPLELIIHPRIVVSCTAGEAILEQMSSAEPTPAFANSCAMDISAAPTEGRSFDV